MRASERLSALLDEAVNAPIERLIVRLREEQELGYYKGYTGQDMLRVVIKWAEKCQRGEA